MFIRNPLAILLVFVSFITPLAAGAETVILPISEGKDAAAKYAASSGFETAEISAQVFPNGNSFIRLNESEVAGKDVIIPAPSKLTPDGFMELVLAIGTAKQNFARSVTVEGNPKIVDSKTGEALSQNLQNIRESLFKAAGAKVKISSNAKRRHLNVQPTGEAFVININHRDLSIELGKSLGLKVVPDMDTTATVDKLGQYAGSKLFVVMTQVSPVNRTILEPMGLINSLRRAGAEIHLVAPYTPYARSDRVDDAGGNSAQGKIIGDMLQRVGVSEMTYARAHAPQFTGFYGFANKNLDSRPVIMEYLLKQGVKGFVSPDNGAVKDVTGYADHAKLPLWVVNQSRDPVTTKKSLKGIIGEEPIYGKKIAIIDDETASGGTLARVAELLKRIAEEQLVKAEREGEITKAQGISIRKANGGSAVFIFATVTHLAGEALSALNSPDIDKFVVTNTIPIPESVKSLDKMKVLDITAELAAFVKKVLPTMPTCGALSAQAGVKL